MKNIVSYGGGTQSTAMILMALNGDYGLSRPDFGVYADTGGEPEFINEYVRYFIKLVKDTFDFEIFIVKNNGNGLYQSLLNEVKVSKSTGNRYLKSNPPLYVKQPDGKRGIIIRECTTDYKIKPIESFIKSRIEKGYMVRQWIGISFDERQRIKISQIKGWVKYYPLVENFIRRKDSIDYIKKWGIKSPQRSSCFFCPFHSDRYWQWLKDFHPSEFKKAVELDYILRNHNINSLNGVVYLHSSCKPLDQVQFTDENQLNMFPELIDECGGECGI